MKTTTAQTGFRRRAAKALGVASMVPLRGRLTAVLVVFAVGVAGCGEGDESADSSLATTTTVTTGDGDERRSGDDQAKAEGIVLRASDFPTDWTSEPAEADDEAADAAFRACLGLEPEDAAAAEAESPSFSTGATEVTSSVRVAPSADVIDESFAAFQGPKMLECVTQRTQGEFEEESQVTLTPPRAERIDFPELGDGSTAVRVTSSFPAEGEQVPLYIDLVAIKKDRVGISLTVVNASEPFPTAAAVELAEKMVARA